MNNNKDFFINKTVKVSDAFEWCGRKEINVSMHHPKYWDNMEEMKNCVRIMFMSADDKAVYRDFTEWELESNWEWCKKWLFDKIPNTVSRKWMYEHGYVPF